jgi:hypothetical protein
MTDRRIGECTVIALKISVYLITLVKVSHAFQYLVSDELMLDLVKREEEGRGWVQGRIG